MNFEEIEKYAKYQFSIDEIAIIIECEAREIEDSEEALQAYMRGRLKTQAEVRESLIQMATSGSSPAQKEFFRIADKSSFEIE